LESSRDNLQKSAIKNRDNIIYKSMNCMNTYIKTDKDKIKKEDYLNVVYTINCHDCNYSYVGQTKRKLKARLKEHNRFKKPTNSLTYLLSQT